MATTSAISSAIATATTLGITYTQLEALVKQAIASGLTDDGRVVVSVGSDGTQIGFNSLKDAIEAVKILRELSMLETGGGSALAPCEMVNG